MSESRTEPNRTHLSQTSHFSPWFLGVCFLAFALRLMAIGRPLLGVFATKNVVYAMIARNLVEHRASFWLPRLDCLRGGQRGLHLLEVPLSAYLAGGLWKGLGGSLDVWGRAVSIGLSVASVVILFDYVRRRHGQPAAMAAATVLALSPVAVIYGQCFMLEASVVFLTLSTMNALDRWISGRRTVWLAVAASCFALLALTKIYMIVLLLPIGYMLFAACRVRARTHQPLPCRIGACKHTPYRTTLVFLVASLPAVVWVLFVVHVASPGGSLADQVFYSLRDSTEAHGFPHPLLGQADFYRQLFDDFSGVVLTPVAFMLPFAGLLDRQWRRYAVWLLAMAILVVAMPRKFYEMNYYYTVSLPPIAIVAGLGWARLAERLRPSRAAVVVVLVLSLLASLRYTAGPMLKTPEEDRAVLPAAQAVRELTAGDEPVVTMHGSGIDLLYYCDRPGWALEPDEPELIDRLAACRRAGAKRLVIVDVDGQESPDRDLLPGGMTLITQGDGFRIYGLPNDR
ncbi:MAG: glycosyltransferase family 39 protein [Pirellulales bacterium]|nr:glycosyltransferase family 39 protein [Pirellulales bacterium]